MKGLIRGYLPRFSRLSFFVLLLLITACANDPAPTATIVRLNQEEIPTVMASSTPIPTLMPTASLPSPVVVNSPNPTVTIAPADTVTPLPTATPPIPGMIGPDNFPADVNPLTGLVVSNPAVLDRRPIAVKISNIARVRPQAGLNNADLVFEHMTEGTITRFTAVFYTNGAEKIGSIRSGRLIDLQIPIMYDAAFAYSGASIEVRQRIRESVFFPRVISPDFAHGGFERISDPDKPNQPFEDTLFTDTDTLHFILNERGQDVAPNFHNGMAFHPDPPEGGTPASSIEVNYSATDAFWSYQPGLGRYWRWSDGVPHLDANTEDQISFKNIIVLRANHVNTDIIEDSYGSPSIEIQIWGEGPVSIFRDGRQYDGVWKRAVAEDMLTFYDFEGNLLPLAPGNSFFQIIPLDFTKVFVEA